jgi:hypothetical protein
MLAVMPVALAALIGAASNPTVTFHGYFDDYTVVPGGTCKTPGDLEFAGTCSARIPDPTVGAHAWLNVQSRLGVDVGNPLAFQFEPKPQTLLATPTKAESTAHADSALWPTLPPDRELTSTGPMTLGRSPAKCDRSLP